MGNKAQLQAIIKKLCSERLGAEVDDFAIELAIKRHSILKANSWNRMSKWLDTWDNKSDEIVIAVAKKHQRAKASSWDSMAEKLKQDDADLAENPSVIEEAFGRKLNKFVETLVTKVEKKTNASPHERSTQDRFLEDYFFPTLRESEQANSRLLGQLNDKLDSHPENTELANYKQALIANSEYLDSVGDLPFAIEKLFKTLSENSGGVHSANEKALVITSLLDTMQSSGEGIWTAEKLLQVLKIVTTVTMPDLHVDSISIEAIKELLPYVNVVIQNSKTLEVQKAIIFPVDDPKVLNARKAFFSSVGVEFSSLTQLCQKAFRKPIEEVVKAKNALQTHAKGIKTEQGWDYLEAVNTLDQMGSIIDGMPQELLPRSLQPYAKLYVSVVRSSESFASGVGDAVSTAGQLLGVGGEFVGQQVLEMTPEHIKKQADQVVDKMAEVTLSWAPTGQKVIRFIDYITPTNYTPYVPKQTFISVRDKLLGAAAYFVPAYFKNKFKEPDPKEKFWQSLNAPSDSLDPTIVEAFFFFHELESNAKSPMLAKEAFSAFMQKANITTTYDEYLSFKKTLRPEILNSSLKEQLEQFEKADNDQQYELMLYSLQRMKIIENEVDDEKSFDVLNEFREAIKFKSQDARVTNFQSLYLQPAFENYLLRYQQNHFMPQLEKLLDKGQEKYRDIYSSLKAGKLLSESQLDELKRSSSTELSYIDDKTEIIAKEFAPAKSEGVVKAQTPKEESRQKIQKNLDAIQPVIDHIAEGLAKQLESCKRLRALSPNDPIKSLCDAKIKYLERLQQCINQLIKDSKSQDQVLAENIRKIATGEMGKDLKAMANAKNIAIQLNALRWEVRVPTSRMVTASVSEKLLAYALSHSEYLQGMVEVKHQYEKTIKNTPPPPELMQQLGNPLKVDIVNEEVVRKAVASGLDLGKNKVIQPFITNYLIGSALGYVFPQVLLVDIARGILTRPSVKAQIIEALGPVGDFISDATGMISENITPYQEKLVGPIKDKICTLLSIEVQQILEQKAFEYAASDQTKRSTLKAGERDAFAGFYLQYRAIKKNNPTVDKNACISYLFQSLSKLPVERQQTITQQLSGAFERLDREFKEPAAERTQKAELENELRFLLDKIDFDSPNESELMTMTIYNRLVMMQFEAANQLDEVEARLLHQKAMNTLGSVLINLEKADAKNPSIRLNARAEQFAPATKLAAKTKFSDLEKELTKALAVIGKQISLREGQIDAELEDDEPKVLGKSVWRAEFAKRSGSNVVANVMYSASKVLPLLLGITLLVVGLVGVAGVLSVGLGLASLLLLAATVTLSVVSNIVKEARAHDNEFSDIVNSDKSNITKLGLIAATGLKCVVLGVGRFARAVFNYGARIVDGIIHFGDWFRVHPTKETLQNEIKVLSELETKLTIYKKLIIDQKNDKQSVDFDPTKPDASKFYLQKNYDDSLAVHQRMARRAEEIEAMTQGITIALDKAGHSLANSSESDARWMRNENQELEVYKTTFSKLKEFGSQVVVIQELEVKMQPQMTTFQLTATSCAQNAEEYLSTVTRLSDQFTVEKDKLNLVLKSSLSTEKIEDKMEGLSQLVAAISEASTKAEVEATKAYSAAKESGEVGYFSYLTAITGPTMIACNRANLAVSSINKINEEVVRELSILKTKCERSDEVDIDAPLDVEPKGQATKGL